MVKRKKSNQSVTNYKKPKIAPKEVYRRIEVIDSALKENHIGSHMELISLAKSVGYKAENRNGHKVLVSQFGGLVKRVNGYIFMIPQSRGNLKTGTYRDALKSIKHSLENYLNSLSS